MKFLREFLPKSYLCLKGYSFADFKKDLFAGLTVGMIALPLAMAFSIASGVSPEKGLVTAIIAGFFISLLGGSRFQVGGPTGAFVTLVYSIVQRNGYEGLALATFFAAFLLIGMALLRLGSWMKYVPYPLILGFTAGIAFLIFFAQIKDLLGLPIEALPASFLGKWSAYSNALLLLDRTTAILGGATLLFIFLLKKLFPKLPWGITAIVCATLVVSLFQLPVETIQTRFGSIPDHLSLPTWPTLSVPPEKYGEIAVDAMAIALLGGIESLLSCAIADGMALGPARYKSNCELMGQGVANLASVLFGGIPATGAIARTATNVKSGAKTPVAGMIHAITLFAILLFFSPLVNQIPLAALAAVLVRVSWDMSEAGHLVRLLKAPRGDLLILSTAFFLTIFVDIIAAIGVGMVLAAFLFMRDMSRTARTLPAVVEGEALTQRGIPHGVEVFEIQGPFFFGAADMLRELRLTAPRACILRMRHVPLIDVSGMQALKEFHARCQRSNIRLLLSEVLPQAKKDMDLVGCSRLLGEENFCQNLEIALQKLHDPEGEKSLSRQPV